MRLHSQRLNIKTTQLASLTAVFRSKKQPRLPATDRMDIDQDDYLAGPSGQANGSDIAPEVPTSRLDDSESDRSCRSDGNETSEGMLGDSDSDEFESEQDVSRCEMGEGRGPLEFELRAAKAGNIRRGGKILIELIKVLNL